MDDFSFLIKIDLEKIIFFLFFLNCDNFYNKVLYKMYDEINIK